MLYDADDPRNPDNNPNSYWVMLPLIVASIVTLIAVLIYEFAR